MPRSFGLLLSLRPRRGGGRPHPRFFVTPPSAAALLAARCSALLCSALLCRGMPRQQGNFNMAWMGNKATLIWHGWMARAFYGMVLYCLCSRCCSALLCSLCSAGTCPGNFNDKACFCMARVFWHGVIFMFMGGIPFCSFLVRTNDIATRFCFDCLLVSCSGWELHGPSATQNVHPISARGSRVPTNLKGNGGENG